MRIMVPRLKEKFRTEIAGQLTKEFGYTSVMQVPVLSKITINQGLGKAVADKKLIDAGLEELGLITGQRPSMRLASKSVSNFKLRKGMPIGVRVTLRGNRMYEFLDRLVNIALPRVRDFRGLLERGFDGKGNYNLGVEEQIVFPEIHLDKVNRIVGMNISLVTTASTDAEGISLLKAFGFPLVKRRR